MFIRAIKNIESKYYVCRMGRRNTSGLSLQGKDIGKLVVCISCQ
jgi:hypothetical protein